MYRHTHTVCQGCPCSLLETASYVFLVLASKASLVCFWSLLALGVSWPRPPRRSSCCSESRSGLSSALLDPARGFSGAEFGRCYKRRLGLSSMYSTRAAAILWFSKAAVEGAQSTKATESTEKRLRAKFCQWVGKAAMREWCEQRLYSQEYYPVLCEDEVRKLRRRNSGKQLSSTLNFETNLFKWIVETQIWHFAVGNI